MSGFPKTPDEVNGDDSGGESLGGGLGLTGLDAAPTKKINGQIVLAVGAIVIAGGLLYGMRTFGLGSRESLADLVVDYPLESVQRQTEARRYQRVIDELDRSSRPYQIAEDKLEVNPFSIPAAIVVEDEDLPLDYVADPRQKGPSAEELKARRLSKRQGELREEFSKLNLQSVVGGRVPVAIIDGRLIRVGDEVGSFTVARIDGRAVTMLDDLEPEHQGTYTLYIKEKSVKGEMNVQKDESDEDESDDNNK